MTHEEYAKHLAIHGPHGPQPLPEYMMKEFRHMDEMEAQGYKLMCKRSGRRNRLGLINVWVRKNIETGELEEAPFRYFGY